jgi:hypothetical protein
MPLCGSGVLAQLGERLLCKQDVVGSIPTDSTISWLGLPDRVEQMVSSRVVFEVHGENRVLVPLAE